MYYAPQDPNPIAPFAQALSAVNQAQLNNARRDQIRQESLARFQGMGTPGASIAFQPQVQPGSQPNGLGAPTQQTRDQLQDNRAGQAMMQAPTTPTTPPMQAPQPQIPRELMPQVPLGPTPPPPMEPPALPGPEMPSIQDLVRFRQQLAPMLAQQPHLAFRNLSQALGSTQAAQELIGQGPVSPDTMQRLMSMSPIPDTSAQVGYETPAMQQEHALAEATGMGGQFAAGPVGQEPVEPGSFGETAQAYGPQTATQLAGQDIQKLRWQRYMGLMEQKMLANYKDPIYQSLQKEVASHMSPAGMVLDEAGMNLSKQKLNLRQAVVAEALAGVPQEEIQQDMVSRFGQTAQQFPELLQAPPVGRAAGGVSVGGRGAGGTAGKTDTNSRKIPGGPGWVDKLSGPVIQQIMQARAKNVDWQTIQNTPEVQAELGKTNYRGK
jgi:hypothetical protein